MVKFFLTLALRVNINATNIAQYVKTKFASNVFFGSKAGLYVSNVYDTNGKDFVAKAKRGIVMLL